MESSSQQLTFHILDILTRDEAIPAESGEDNGRTAVAKEMVIHLFGKTATGQSIRADVKGFRPFFYISIPSKATRGQAFQSIRTYLTSNKIDTTAYDLTYEEKQLFFGYHRGTKFPFARISVGSISMFRSIKNCFLNGETSRPALRAGKRLAAPFTTPPDVFEANLDPMLRFFHLRNIDPCGWITIKDVELTAADAAADREIHVECDWTDCEQVTGAVAPFLIASWDIECYSATGDFPLANKGYASVAKELYTRATDPDHATALLLNAFYPGSVECVGVIREIQTRGRRPSKEQLEKWLGTAALRDGLARLRSGGEKEECIRAATAALDSVLGRVGRAPVAGDPMIQIGTVLAVAGQPARTERHIFVWPSCDPVEGAVVHVCPTEADMIRAWTAWMAERDPDILIGYNVFGFDEKYFWDRATELAVDDCEEIQRLGRLCEDGGRVKLEEKFLSSSALGDNIMHMWSIQGRLQVDMFHYVKRTVPTLPSYKLDEVTKNFMSGGLIKATQDGNALQLEVKGSWADARPGRYVCLLDDTGESLTDKLLVLASSKGSVRVAWEDRGDEAEPWLEATQWVIVKDDVSPAELFRLHGGSSADRARIAAYCVQDCDLVLDLYYKLEVFNTAMSMANVCAVPVGYIMTRGQGIKIESLMFKEAYKRGKAVMVLPAPAGQGGGESEQQDSYEGAIVLKPTIGLLDSPVGVADFASLYPSTIVSENISHDTLLWVKDFDHDGRLMKVAWQSNLALDLPAEIPFTDIEFDLLKADPEDKRKDPRKTAVGKRICRYAQDDKGLLPIIIEGLLAARKATRALIPKETDPLKIALLDAQQNAYKITANSLYGQLGSGTFKLRLQHLAASVTGYGRKQIMFAKEVIERFYGAEAGNGRTAAKCEAKTVYGDSVVGNTALFMRRAGGVPFTVRMDELFVGDDGRWAVHHDTKEAIDLSADGLEVWTERGFTPVRRLIRHRLAPHKKLYRILTHTGVVDATEDHSLVRPDGTECRPADVAVGMQLLHNNNQHTTLGTVDTTINENEAWVMGFFLADGSADVYNCPSGVKASWAINKSNMAVLEEARRKCPFNTKILDTLESSGVYKLVASGENTTAIARRYRELFYNSHREKRVPSEILNAPLNIVKAFWDGFYTGDGDKDEMGYCRFDQKGKDVCTGLYLLARKLGYNVSINDRASKLDCFRLTMTMKPQRKDPTAIKVIRELPHPGEAYVYDFETENHHFAVGPGALVVHNTDSLFVQFNPLNPETGERLTGREARVAAIELTGEAGHLVTQVLKAPHDFEFDKVYDPLLMFNKKLYAGKMYENDRKPDDYVYKYMGISIKRRGNAPLVKTIYGAALNKVLEDKDVAAAAEIVRRGCTELVEGRTKLGQLIITKSLKAEYAHTPPAHKVLADRIKVRDPGNAPAAGDRLAYVYIRPQIGQAAPKLQGERIETPQFVRSKGLTVDYEFYIEHQLMNPISQMFGLLLEHVPGFRAEMLPEGWRGLDQEKQFAVREKVAAQLLFGEALGYLRESSKQAFIGAMGGRAVKSVVAAVSGVAPRRTGASSSASAGAGRGAAPVPAKKQSVLDSWLRDTTLTDDVLLKLSRKKANARDKLRAELEAETTAILDI